MTRLSAPAEASRGRGAGEGEDANGHRADAAIRPERFARLVTLASILIDAGRAGRLLVAAELCAALKISDQELREDISVLNVVNFGAGTYVLYAEIHPDGSIEVDPEPYGDSFARPARLLPVEAKALIAAIDLIGEHIPEGSLTSVRQKVVDALGEDPVHEGLQFAAAGRRQRRDRRRGLQRDRQPPDARPSSTTSPTRTSSPAAGSSPMR